MYIMYTYIYIYTCSYNQLYDSNMGMSRNWEYPKVFLFYLNEKDFWLSCLQRKLYDWNCTNHGQNNNLMGI